MNIIVKHILECQAGDCAATFLGPYSCFEQVLASKEGMVPNSPLSLILLRAE